MMHNMLTIRFTPQRLDYVYNVLRTRPHAEVDDLIVDIRAQVQAQQSEGPQTGPQEAPNGAGGTSASAES